MAGPEWRPASGWLYDFRASKRARVTLSLGVRRAVRPRPDHSARLSGDGGRVAAPEELVSGRIKQPFVACRLLPPALPVHAPHRRLDLRSRAQPGHSPAGDAVLGTSCR